MNKKPHKNTIRDITVLFTSDSRFVDVPKILGSVYTETSLT